MDPDATLALARDADATPAERATAAYDLLDWLDRGGFLPAGTERRALLAELETIARTGNFLT